MYANLSREQKSFVKNSEVAAELSIAKWVKFLEPICQYDDIADLDRVKVISWRNNFMILAILTLLISLSISTTSIYSLLSIFFVFIIAIKLFSLVSFYKNSDVNNNVRKVIFPLLQMLALESGHQKKVRLSINFKKSNNKNDITQAFQEGNTKTTIYTYEVLEADCTLMDSTKFSLKIIDTIRKRRVKKCTASGKIKYKNKFKQNRKIGLILGFNKQHYSINSNKVGEADLFKENDKKITYKKTLKQACRGKTALIDIEYILEQAQLPYSYLIAQSPQ